MARQRQTRAKSKTHVDDEITKKWGSLTWEDLGHWAGNRSASRGRTYARRGSVADLTITEDGKLLATVTGTDRYVTSVWFANGRRRVAKLESRCTCPVGFDACKHAVAVVLIYLDAMAEGNVVPLARPDDRRWAKLTSQAKNDHDEFGEDLDDEEWDDDVDWEIDDESDGEWTDDADVDSEMKRKPRRGRSVSSSVKRAHQHAAQGNDGKRRSRAEWDEEIGRHIRAKSHEELAELVCGLVGRFPELRAEFQERIALAEGDVGRLVNQARRDLRTLTAEIGWRNHWDGEGHTPDYSRLKHKLERLVEGGHHDEVVKLGDELIRRGIAQIEQSHDEGETAMEVSDCLPIVFDALARSSLQATDKILHAIDAVLLDEYDLIGDAANGILGNEWTRADWSIVADRLSQRLRKMPAGDNQDEFTRDYQRDCLSNWLLHALERAGRSEELLPLYEKEARTTGSYQRLVEYLLQEKRLDDAERWAREGIEKMQGKWPGIASALRETLCELARRRKDWPVVAAHAARDFFDSPSVKGFRDLVAATKKAKCEKQVRAAALDFLESGCSPVSTRSGRKSKRKGKTESAWPLPVPEYLAPPPVPDTRGQAARRRHQPHYEVLLEMAIADKKPDEVLHWHDKMAASDRSSEHRFGDWRASTYSAYTDQVATAVASTHPERALDIYRHALDGHLDHADVSAYESCAAYLRKMRPVLKSLGRDKEWTQLVAEIRQSYRNRPRFMEILDALEGRTILQARKSRRRR